MVVFMSNPVATETTKTYRVTNTMSGQDLGEYQVESAAAALAAMMADAGCAGEEPSDDLVADELTVYQPVPRSDRPETAPTLPTRICEWADGRCVAYYADWSPERYVSISDLCREHQMSSDELGA